MVKAAPPVTDTTDSTTQPGRDLSPRLFQFSILFTACSVVSAAMAVLVGLWLRSRTTLQMDDLIDVTNPSYPKQIDLWVIAIWASLTTVGSLLSLRVGAVRRAATRVGNWLSGRANVLVWLAVAAAPILPWLTNLADSFPRAHLWGSVATTVLVVVGLAAYGVGTWRSQPTARVLTALLLIGAGALGAFTALSLAAAKVVPGVTWPWWVPVTAAAIASLGILAWGAQRQARLTRAVLLAQTLVPLLLLVLIAPLGASNTALLIVAMALVVIALVILAARRAVALWSAGSWQGTVNLSSIAVLAAYAAGLLRLPSGAVPGDEYHWGELLVQWDQLTTYGAKLFVDYTPAPGLNGFVYGALNQVLGGDSITFQRSVQIVAAVLAVLIVIAAARVLGKPTALLMVPAAATLAGGGVADRFALVALSALLLALPGLWRRPLAWLGVWLLLVPCNLLFIPASGTAFIIASSPAVVFQAVRWLRAWRATAALDYAVMALAVLLLGALAGTLVDILSFVASQGAANDVAWGLPMLPWQSPFESAYIASLNVVRMAGWWLGIPIAAALVFAGWRGRPQRGMLLLAVSTVLIAAALTPYVFGRIERSGLSRVGVASILILGLLLPLAVRGIRAPLTGGFGAVLVRTSAVIVVTVIGLPGAVLTQGFAPYRPLAGPMVDGAAIGLPKLGAGSAAQADSLVLRQQIVDAALGDDSVAVDLANRQAYYFFAGVAQPTTLGAYWNMIGQAEQDAVVADLRRTAPDVVFPDTVNSADPGFWEPTMRPYRVVRWLWDNGYRAYDFAGQTVLLSPPAAVRVDDRFRQLTAQEADDRLVGIYPRLGEMFATWGSNWPSLRDRFVEVPAQVSVSESSVTLSFPEAEPSPDFILLDVQCAQPPADPATMTWALTDGSDYARPVPLQPGTSLIPLGAYPSWHDGPADGLTVTPPPGCTAEPPPQMLQLVR